MALRIRITGEIFCAALTNEEKGDCYIDDQTHYELSVEKKILVTTYNDYHMANGGQWWWKGQEPTQLTMNPFYYST